MNKIITWILIGIIVIAGLYILAGSFDFTGNDGNALYIQGDVIVHPNVPYTSEYEAELSSRITHASLGTQLSWWDKVVNWWNSLLIRSPTGDVKIYITVQGYTNTIGMGRLPVSDLGAIGYEDWDTEFTEIESLEVGSTVNVRVVIKELHEGIYVTRDDDTHSLTVVAA